MMRFAHKNFSNFPSDFPKSLPNGEEGCLIDLRLCNCFNIYTYIYIYISDQHCLASLNLTGCLKNGTSFGKVSWKHREAQLEPPKEGTNRHKPATRLRAAGGGLTCVSLCGRYNYTWAALRSFRNLRRRHGWVEPITGGVKGQAGPQKPARCERITTAG